MSSLTSIALPQSDADADVTNARDASGAHGVIAEWSIPARERTTKETANADGSA